MDAQGMGIDWSAITNIIQPITGAVATRISAPPGTTIRNADGSSITRVPTNSPYIGGGFQLDTTGNAGGAAGAGILILGIGLVVLIVMLSKQR